MARLRIALFGSSCNYSERALLRLAQEHEVAAAVLPRAPASRLRDRLGGLVRRASTAGFEATARGLGVPVLRADPQDEWAERLRSLRPDLICIALFPRRVAASVAAIAPLGAINAHPSALPRHRGPLPLFWTYHADDREAGVTIHRATDRLDAGEILLQETFPLARGYPVSRLDHDVAGRAADLLARAAGGLERGSLAGSAQDESAATYAPLIRPGAAMARFDEWDVERAWHFLAGLCPPYREPLLDAAGRPVRYDRVVGYERNASGGPPGRVERAAGGWVLHCRGGTVQLV